jgi:3-deoxy-D-manno-octulosonic acid kinase
VTSDEQDESRQFPARHSSLVTRHWLPPGFELIKEGRLRVAIRPELRAALLPLVREWAAGAPPRGRTLPGGRGGARAVDLGANLAVVLRPYRRGGFIARFNRDLFFGCRPRPWRELAVTEQLRARGVPTVEVLAAAVRWIVPACYRGVLVSREVPEAVNLWEELQRVEPPQRAVACEAAAAATRLLHDRGAVHPDLNLQNYLVRRRRGTVEVFIIDCDRVDLRAATAADRQKAFERLCRSIRRLDPMCAVVTLGCVEALRAITESEPD